MSNTFAVWLRHMAHFQVPNFAARTTKHSSLLMDSGVGRRETLADASDLPLEAMAGCVHRALPVGHRSWGSEGAFARGLCGQVYYGSAMEFRFTPALQGHSINCVREGRLRSRPWLSGGALCTRCGTASKLCGIVENGLRPAGMNSTAGRCRRVGPPSISFPCPVVASITCGLQAGCSHRHWCRCRASPCIDARWEGLLGDQRDGAVPDAHRSGCFRGHPLRSPGCPSALVAHRPCRPVF